MNSLFYTRFMVGCLWCTQLIAGNHTINYQVQPGDTLWHILKKHDRPAHHWPQIWQANPHIANPHQLKPGDQLKLPSWPPSLQPSIKRMPLDEPHHIPLSSLRPFLDRSEVFSVDQIEQAPQITHTGPSMQGQMGGTVYAQRLDEASECYDVVRPHQAYHQPGGDDVLGVACRLIAKVRISKRDDPTALEVTKLQSPIQIGDRVVPVSERTWPSELMLRAPKSNIKGQIIASLDDYKTIGPYQVVVVNQGQLNGLKPGDRLQILQPGQPIRGSESVHLAHRHIGELMIFRIFHRVSYGLILKASQPVHTGYLVRHQIN